MAAAGGVSSTGARATGSCDRCDRDRLKGTVRPTLGSTKASHHQMARNPRSHKRKSGARVATETRSRVARCVSRDQLAETQITHGVIFSEGVKAPDGSHYLRRPRVHDSRVRDDSRARPSDGGGRWSLRGFERRRHGQVVQPRASSRIAATEARRPGRPPGGTTGRACRARRSWKRS